MSAEAEDGVPTSPRAKYGCESIHYKILLLFKSISVFDQWTMSC